MKVLLTGASGFIGRHVLAALQFRGIEVVTVGRRSIPVSADHAKIDLLAAIDLLPILKEVQATHLLHLAWDAEPGKYWTSTLNLRWTEATVRLVEAFCAAGGKQVVLAGTCAEYDWGYGYLKEDVTPLNPSSLYGTAKDVTRRLVYAICSRHSVSCSCGRVFFTFGRGESPARLIPSLMEALTGQRAPFSVDVSSYRDLMHVHDVAEGFMQLLLSKAVGDYNISSSEPTKLYDVVTKLANLLNVDAKIVFNTPIRRATGPKILVGDNSKLKAIGWEPSLTLEQGFERVLRDLNSC